MYKLPFLEILDVSRNKIREISDEISNLTSLRVLSIMQNRLEDLPAELADMNKLQILKVAGNNLRYPLRRVLEIKEQELGNLAVADREVAVTAELKRYLKIRQQQSATPDAESSSETGDIVLDTPKPVKRGGSRFPVIPSTADGVSDPRSLSRPPPLPMKSHQRLASGQSAQGSYARPSISSRPGSSERNRSNSEGIIPSAARSRRIALASRRAELGTLDEMRPYRNSHLRGLSHGSLLRTGSSRAANGGSSPGSGSPRNERRKARDGLMQRLVSLPEHREASPREPIVEGARGILFALIQINPHITTLINVIQGDDARRNSLELVFYNASTHVERLNEALEKVDKLDIDGPQEDWLKVACEVQRECITCLTAYTHVGHQLRQNTGRLVAQGDPRYVRSLLLMVYGSLVELRNAFVVLQASHETRKESAVVSERSPQSESVSGGMDTKRFSGSAVTQGRERPPPPRRIRTDTVIQQAPDTSAPPSNNMLSPGFPLPGSFLNYGTRSRSNSRATTVNTSVPSSLATPRSGETFPSISTPSTATRVPPVTGLEDFAEESAFERIFKQLTVAYSTALQALPIASRQFSRCLEMAEERGEREDIRRMWTNLIQRCRACYEVSDALGRRLSSMKVKEPGGNMRNRRDFWQLSKAFMQSFVELVTDMREVRNRQLLPPDIIVLLRPVQKACREAGRLIEASPWSYLADMSTAPAPNLYGPPLQTGGPPNASSTSASFLGQGALSPPPSVPLPATPLSAALGPAAQATVPSTPSSSYSDRFFAGDVFQRADTLLSMPVQAPYLMRRS